MKNIHVLPTDKPSKLIFYSTLLNEFQLLDEPIEDWERNKNIYITSDQEIKDLDYYLYLKNNRVYRFVKKHHTKLLALDIQKKIILTTDQDLIKDGVQAIDDEFLEWFVKNPNCEEVEVEDYGNLYNFRYLILIPKEESKSNIERLPFPELVKEFAEYYKDIPLVEEPKQETLEYGILQHIKMCLECNNESQAIRLLEKYGFEKQERMYSEEEVVFFLQKYRFDLPKIKTPILGDTTKQWFEQFKKK